MQTHTNKKGVTLVELLVTLVIYGMLSTLVVSLFVFYVSSMDLITEMADSNLASTLSTESIMNSINKFSPQGVECSSTLVSGTNYTETNDYKFITFTRSKIYKAATDPSGNPYVETITPDDEQWTGGTSLTISLSYDDDGFGTLLITESGGEYADESNVQEISVNGLRMMVGKNAADVSESHISVKGYSSSRSAIDCYCITFNLMYDSNESSTTTDVAISIYISI